MLPPKKNQAAREGEALKDKKPVEETTPRKDKQDEEEEEPEYKNVFAETLVMGKRKHFQPKSKQVVDDWLSEHFEEKEGRKCSYSQVYSAYLQLCIEKNITDNISENSLAQILRTKFSKGFVVKEDSGFKGKIKDHSKTPKAASGVGNKYKMKDIIKEAFEDLKDPNDGIMFNTLKKHIMVKVPALQLDIKPKVLLRSLEMGVYHRYVELVKGTGRAGKYRWYNPDRKEEEKPKKKKKSDKEEGDSEGQDGEKDGEPTSADSAQEEDGEKKEGEEDSKEDGSDKKPKAKKRTKKQAKKKKRSKQIVHSNPTTIEETFPLAFTFMAEPKEARVSAIIKYLEKHYDMESQAEKIIKVLDSGAEKGYWHLVQGNNRTGLYQLAVNEFDPTDDDDVIGKIINAIMASVNPKSCSAKALKEYLIEFHPDYKVSERPYLYKKALERAANKGIVRQLTGIGATGTFQLVESFVPSPIILAGKDSASDYEVESSDEEEQFVGKGPSGPQFDVTYFQDAYKPRPSKRRGMSREVAKTGGFDKNAAYFEANIKQQNTVKVAPKRKASPGPKKSSSKNKKTSKPTPKKRARYDSSSDEEEEEQESSDEEDSTYGSDGDRYVPRGTKSRGGRGGGSQTPAKPSKKSTNKASVSKSKAAGKKGKSTTPAKKEKAKPVSAKGKQTPKKSSAKSKASKNAKKSKKSRR